jgi:hypothetical protein
MHLKSRHSWSILGAGLDFKSFGSKDLSQSMAENFLDSA